MPEEESSISISTCESPGKKQGGCRSKSPIHEWGFSKFFSFKYDGQPMIIDMRVKPPSGKAEAQNNWQHEY